MERDELFADLLEGIAKGWHWWDWHFQRAAAGEDIPFVTALVDALLAIDSKMPGYAGRSAAAIVALGGRDHHKPDYEQLLQRLAEIHVALHAVRTAWPTGTTFADEPVAPGSGRNPEFVISTADLRIGVEVKAPALLQHAEQRSSNPFQAAARTLPPNALEQLAGEGKKVTLPRDNPVKDFLLSADAKFAPFHEADADFYGLLVIVWDDFIYEPVSSLTNPSSGLFTPSSFATDEQGAPLKFAHMDGIVLVSHLQFLKLALSEDGAGRPFEIGRDIFRWNIDPARPAAYLDTPAGKSIPGDVQTLLSTRPLDELPGAEYHPSDLVIWINPVGPE